MSMKNTTTNIMTKQSTWKKKAQQSQQNNLEIMRICEELKKENKELKAKLDEWKKQCADEYIDFYHCEEHDIWYQTAGTGDNYCEYCDDYVLRSESSESSSSEED